MRKIIEQTQKLKKKKRYLNTGKRKITSLISINIKIDTNIQIHKCIL